MFAKTPELDQIEPLKAAIGPLRDGLDYE